MPCMTLGELLTGIGYAQQAMATATVLGVYMSVTEALCLIVSSTGKVSALRCHTETYW